MPYGEDPLVRSPAPTQGGGYGKDPIVSGASAPPKAGDEKIYYNDAGQPFTASGKPVPSEKQPEKPKSPDEFHPTLMPFSMEGGFHLALPEIVGAPLRGLATGGRRLLGRGEQGQDPMRPLSPDELATVSLFAGPSAALARGGGLTKSPLSQAPPATAPQRLLQDFETAGVTPNLPAVGQGRTAGLVSQVGNVLPITGPQVRGAVTRTLGDTAQATEKAAAGYGAAEGPLEAGEGLQRGVTEFAKGPGPDSFAVRSHTLYRAFEQQMNPAAQVPLVNTLKALETPMDRFPTSPELGAQLTNPRLRSYAETLEPSVKTIPPVYSSLVGANGQPILLQAAQKIQKGGTLSFGELKELRSTIGRALGEPTLVNDIPKADLRRVYGAISKDLKGAAAAAGPNALKAFNRANDHYRAGLARIEEIEGLLAGSPEQAFGKINRAAQKGTGADVGQLQAVKKSIPAADWNNVGAATIRRLGEPTPGAKDVLAEQNFSVSSFSTNWAKISDEAKDVLFGANTPGSPRSGLETLSRIVQAQKNVGKLANVSRSAEHITMLGLAAWAIEHHSAIMAHPLSYVAGGVGAYGAAKLLMSPGFSRWLYRLPDTVQKAPNLSVAVQRAAVSLDAAMNDKPRREDKLRMSPTQPGMSAADPYATGMALP